ncbi:MAG TPA: PKD domain-containing protein [Chitinophagales bacterium]|nr:PKD domain-containing protein [Chitinophagales bacterium]
MKRVAVSLLFFAVALRAFPQCTPDTAITQVGFYPPDSLLDCIERGIFYDEVIQFKNFTAIPGSAIGFPGVPYFTIISVQIDSIHNLPSGINYACHNPNCFYTTGENGCVRITGITNDPPGEYNLGFFATVVIDFQGTPITAQADSQLLADNGLGYKLKVINPGDICHVLPECSIDTTITQVGFYPPDTLLDCIETGIYYDEVIQFKNFSLIAGSTFGCPTDIIILSVEIDSVRNLPDGIRYACSHPGCYYTTGDNGCVHMSGITNAAPGIYHLGFYATVTVDCNGFMITLPLDSQFLADNGLGYSLTVIHPGSPCPNVLPGQIYVNAGISSAGYCEGDTIQLYATASGGSPPYSFAWSPGGNLSDPSIANPLLYPTNPGIYSVTVSDNFGFSASDNVTIAYGRAPVISLTPDTTICPGQTIQLNASGGASYQWTPPVWLSADNIPNPLASPESDISYTVTVFNASCSSTAAMTVTVDTTLPQAGFTVIKNNFTVFFNNISVNAVSYFWDFGDGSTDTIKSPQHIYTQLSDYTVMLIAASACGAADTFTAAVDLSVGMQGAEMEKLVDVFPNPGDGKFRVRIVQAAGSGISYSVFALHGEMVKSGAWILSGMPSLLDMRGVPAGIYFLKVTGRDFSVIKKVMVR